MYKHICRFSWVIAIGILLRTSAQSTHAQIFLDNAQAGTIGEYSLSGDPINTSLVSGLDLPAGMAIEGDDIFVANERSGTIGEYTTSGAVVNSSLITGLQGPFSLAVSGNDLFVGSAGSIGEYTTSGGTINSSLVANLQEPYGGEGIAAAIALSGDTLYVNVEATYGFPGAVEAFSTTGALLNNKLITGLVSSQGLAMVGDNLLVASRPSSGYQMIGEYSPSGSVINPSLITLPTTIATAIFISGNDVYASDLVGVQEYTTSGDTVSANLISTDTPSIGLVVVDTPEPSQTCLLLTSGGMIGGLRFWRNYRRRKFLNCR
jgi:glucose/arabinose dehydrogenase